MGPNAMMDNGNDDDVAAAAANESRPLLFGLGGGRSPHSTASQQTTQHHNSTNGNNNYASLPAVMARRPSPPQTDPPHLSQPQPQQPQQRVNGHNKPKKLHHKLHGHRHTNSSNGDTNGQDALSVHTRSSRRTAASRHYRRNSRSSSSLRSGPSLMQPNKPRQNCCLWFFHLLNGLAVVACLAVVVSQVVPPLLQAQHEDNTESDLNVDATDPTTTTTLTWSFDQVWTSPLSFWERVAPLLLRGYVAWFALVLIWVETEWCTTLHSTAQATCCLSFVSESPLLQSYWSRGFLYTFLGLVSSVQGVLTQEQREPTSVTVTVVDHGSAANQMEDADNDNATHLSDVWHSLQQGDVTVKQIGQELQNAYQTQVTQLEHWWDDYATLSQWVHVLGQVSAMALCGIGLVYMVLGVCCLEKVRRRMKRQEHTSWRKYRRALSEWKQQRELYPHHTSSHEETRGPRPPLGLAGGSSEEEHHHHEVYYQHDDLYPLHDHDEESLSSGDEEGAYYVSTA